MTEGEKLRATISYVRDFCDQLAVLLNTADILMAKHGFEQAGAAMCAIETSGSIQFPSRWFPNELFRFHCSTDHPNVIAFVSVLLDDRGKEYSPSLPEPLVSAGAFLLATPDDDWKWWWARWHGWMPNRVDDGTLLEADGAVWPKETFRRVATLGVPLVGVQDSAALSAKVVDPLVKAVRRWRDASDQSTTPPQ